MPIEYQVDHRGRIVFAKGRGRLTDQDVFGYQNSVWSRPGVAGYDELMDMLAVESIEIPSTDRMRELASLSAAMDAPGIASRFAVVATNQIAYLLGKIYEAMRGLDERSTKEVAVFRTITEALNWLGRDVP